MSVLMNRTFDIDELWLKGGKFVENFNAAAAGVVSLKAYPTRGTLMGSDLNKALFLEQMIKAGILMGPSWFYNFPLIEFDKTTLAAVGEICGKIKRGEVTLEGSMPVKPFALLEREKK